MHRLSSTTRAAMRTVTLRCEPTMPSCEQASDRLRSWAVVSDVPHEGAPFVRVEGDEWSAHIVTSSDSPGDPQAGILVSETPAQQLLIVDDVRFDAIHTVLRELEQVVLAGMKYDRQGAPEFHSLDGAFMVGTLALPLTADFDQLPDRLEVADDLDPRLVPVPGDERGTPSLAPMPMPVPVGISAIAISSQFGALGEEVAYRVAAELGWRYCSQQVVQDAANLDPDVEVADVERAIRHRGFFERLLERMAVSGPISPIDGGIMANPALIPTVPFIVPEDDVRDMVDEAMGSLVDEGNVVIAGHGAAAVLADRPGVLRILVEAPVETRVARVANESVPMDEAETRVHDADEERKGYFKDVFGFDWLDATRYDMTVNTGSVTPSVAAASIASVVRSQQHEYDRQAASAAR